VGTWKERLDDVGDAEVLVEEEGDPPGQAKGPQDPVPSGDLLAGIRDERERERAVLREPLLVVEVVDADPDDADAARRERGEEMGEPEGLPSAPGRPGLREEVDHHGGSAQRAQLKLGPVGGGSLEIGSEVARGEHAAPTGGRLFEHRGGVRPAGVATAGAKTIDPVPLRGREIGPLQGKGGFHERGGVRRGD